MGGRIVARASTTERDFRNGCGYNSLQSQTKPHLGQRTLQRRRVMGVAQAGQTLLSVKLLTGAGDGCA